MKCEAKTEAEMRDSEATRPQSIEELNEYIASLTEREHDYGTCVYAMSLAATAAFNYVAGRLGVTGFQASCADLDIIKRTRRIDGPFMLVLGRDMLYPQYDTIGRVSEALNEWLPWAAEEAAKLLDSETEHTSRRVIEHWRELARHAKKETT